MNTFGAGLAMLVVLGAPSVRAQNHSLISGFELGSVGEGSGNGSVEENQGRGNSYGYHANPLLSSQYIVFQSRAAGGQLRPLFKSSRFYLRIQSLPLAGNVAIVKIAGAGTLNPEVDLNADGTLTLADSWYPSIAKSQNAFGVSDHEWHLIEVNVGVGMKVYMDGALWVQGGNMAYPAGPAILFGAAPTATSTSATASLYFDDVLIDSGSARLGAGHSVLLRPIADPANLNHWTNGAGSPASLWMPVKNVPAQGQPVSSATALSQIRNGKNGSNQDYKPSVQSYSDAGVNGPINAVMAIVNDGQESSKGQARAGSVWIDSNPAQDSGYSFDFGDKYTVMGQFPSGWTTHAGPVSANPAVNLNASPVVAVRKASGSGVNVDFLGVYVDYQ